MRFQTVILHCGGKNFHAHKVLLAASSSFFQRLLAGLPSYKNNVLVLTDVGPEILSPLLNFIYEGETFVATDALEKFMTAAERLEIRGLHETTTESEASDGQESRKRPHPQPVQSEGATIWVDDVTAKRIGTIVKKPLPNVSSGPLQSSIKDSSPSSVSSPGSSIVIHRGGASILQVEPEEVSISKVGSLKAGPSEMGDGHLIEGVLGGKPEGIIKKEEDDMKDSYGFSNHEEWVGEGAYDEEYYEDHSEQGHYDEGFVASGVGDEQPQNIPPEISKDKVSLVKPGSHVWTGLTVLGRRRYFCGFCGKTMLTKVGVMDHVRVHTRTRPFVCTACGSRFTQLSSLRRHRRRVHNASPPPPSLPPPPPPTSSSSSHHHHPHHLQHRQHHQESTGELVKYKTESKHDSSSD